VNKTSIEWTDYTWNPIHARSNVGDRAGKTGNFCTRISPGCTHCYASTLNKRWGNGLEYTVPNLAHATFYLDDKELKAPLKLKTPSKIFVGDMFDLFHEAIPTDFVAEVLRVALKTPQHTFQFLTKRAQRMRDLVNRAQELWEVKFGEHMHFGVSVEDQQRALERIPRLQETQASIRFLSVEPQLEHIELGHDTPEVGWISYLRGFDGCDPVIPGIDWVICGGESGPGARPFNLAWAESILEQCKAAAVPFFMKQLGSRPISLQHRIAYSGSSKEFRMPDGFYRHLNDRKGGDISEWPEHLRVREFPASKLVTA
jgi:protein gp37